MHLDMQTDFLDYISQILGKPIISFSALSGGDISKVYKLNTANHELLLKTHSGVQAYAMLSAEKLGLETIAKTATIKTPEVYEIGNYESSSFLVMEYIPIKNPDKIDYEKLGQQLAELHKISTTHFGFDSDNFIGSLPQSNHKNQDWTTFYITERIQPQLDLALQNTLLSIQEIPHFDTMEKACNNLFPDLKPSLLHGDLWGGNYLIASDGTPYLIDPAVYYGQAEADLAMSRLFGGFSSSFYEAYHSVIPKLPNSQERNDLYQLYYLLVHLNLFGRSYYSGVKRILERYFS